jgi:hypothetical protein
VINSRLPVLGFFWQNIYYGSEIEVTLPLTSAAFDYEDVNIELLHSMS